MTISRNLGHSGKFIFGLIYLAITMAIVASSSLLSSQAVANQPRLSSNIVGCFRDSGTRDVTCRLTLKNTSNRDARLTLNSSRDRRPGGLDAYASWAWDDLGNQLQIVDAEFGGQRIRRWRLAIMVPAGLMVAGKIWIADVPKEASRLARIQIILSPKHNVARDARKHEFRDVPIQ